MFLPAMSNPETLRLISALDWVSLRTLYSLLDVATFFSVSNDNLCHKLLPWGPTSRERHMLEGMHWEDVDLICVFCYWFAGWHWANGQAHSSSPSMSTRWWDCCRVTAGTSFLEESSRVGSRGYGWVLQYFITVSHAPFEGYKGKVSGYWWNHQVNCLSLCLGKHTTHFFSKNNGVF